MQERLSEQRPDAMVSLLALAQYSELTLKRRADAHALPKLRETQNVLGEFRTKCFWSAMSPRIAFIRGM